MRHLVLIISLFLTISFSQDKVISENYTIEGMMCSMGCVADVTKAVQDLDGFKTVNFDVDKERKIGYAIVTFDAEVLSREEVVAAIQGVSEGAYKVNGVKKAHCGENFCDHSDSKEKI